MRAPLRANYETLDRAAQYLYPVGIGILLTALLLLGLWGWDGAHKVGTWPIALIGTLLGGAIIWMAPRIRSLTPIRAHWIRPATTSWMDWFFNGLWSLYRLAGRLFNTLSAILEGDGGFMWTILFLVLLISLMTQRPPGS
jgi:hypothetical protein